MTPLRTWLRDWSRWRRSMRAKGHGAQGVIDAQTGGIRYRAVTGAEWAPRPYREPKVKACRIGASTVAKITRLQGGLCYLCPRPLRTPTREHVTPRVLGGRNYRNILMACEVCNLRKGSRRPYACELIYLEAINSRLGLPPREPSPDAPTPSG